MEERRTISAAVSAASTASGADGGDVSKPIARCDSVGRESQAHRDAEVDRDSVECYRGKSLASSTEKQASDERQSNKIGDAVEPKQTDKENQNLVVAIEGECASDFVDDQRCFECKLSLTKSSHLINVDGRKHKWHPECFRCKVCSHQMDRELSCHIYKDQLLCRNDYKRLKRDHSSAKCARCNWPISALDWVRRANNFVYHLACFSCDICSRQLNTGEQFAIETVAGSVRLLCRLHFAVDPTLTTASTQAQSGTYFRKNSPTNEEQVSTHRLGVPECSTSGEQVQPVGASFSNEDLNQDLSERAESSSTSSTTMEQSATLSEQYLHHLGANSTSTTTTTERNRHYSPVVDRINETSVRKVSPSSSSSSSSHQQRKHHSHSHNHHSHHHHHHHHQNHRHQARCDSSSQRMAVNIEDGGAVSLYERRNMGRNTPLLLPGLVSNREHNSGQLDLNHSHLNRDITNELGAGTSLSTNMDQTNACNQTGDHCDMSTAHGSSTVNGDPINNIAGSNCSSMSNSSNTSNSANQMTLSNGSKSKRVRTTFTEDQLAILQTHFQIDSNPDGQDLERIATITGLSKRVTQVWFQNSRARQKKYMTKRKPNSLVPIGMGLSASQSTTPSSSLLPVPSGESHNNEHQTGSLAAMASIVCGNETNDEING